MPVFISYSHSDKEFVDNLALHLMKSRMQVWVDRWELKVGDSILNKIQQAIQEASALLVIMSKSSVSSEWCKKEFTAGLVRELEEKRVVVLPVLLEDCERPLFLRDKLYADFRGNFDDGLARVLEAIASTTSDTRGRLERPKWLTNWAIDRFYEDGLFVFRITFIDFAENLPFCVLTEIKAAANQKATECYHQYAKRNLEWFGRLLILEVLESFSKQEDFRLVLEDEFPKVRTFTFRDSNIGIAFDIEIKSRLLGENTGHDVFLNLAGQIESLTQHVRNVLREPSPEELEGLLQFSPPRV